MSSYTQFCLLTETILWLDCESAVCSVAVQSLKYSAVMYRQLPLNGHLVKAEWTPLKLVPTVLQSFTSSPSKADTSLRRTVGAGPERVRLDGVDYIIEKLID